MNKDEEQLKSIYESLDFKSSYDNRYDPSIEKTKSEANEICHALEHKLQGTIEYYKHHKEEFFKNPSNLNNFDALKNMLRHLREPLYPYQNYRFD
jgi:hypothetical protein